MVLLWTYQLNNLEYLEMNIFTSVEMNDYIEQQLKEVVTESVANDWNNGEIDARGIISILEENDYSAPEVIYTGDAFDFILKNKFDSVKVDFSECESSLACVTKEANAILYQAYGDHLTVALINEHMSYW